MKKLIAILSGVSIAVLIGGFSLADEEAVSEETNTVAVEGDETDEELKTRAKGKKGRGDKDGNGDETQGLNSTSNDVAVESLAAKTPDDGEGDDGLDSALKDCRQCKLKKSYPNLAVKTGEEDGDEAQSPDLTHVRTVKEGDTLPKADVDEDDEASQMKGDFSRGHAPRNKTDENDEDEEDKDEDG